VLEQAGKRHLGVVAMKTMAGIEATALAQMQTALKGVLADPNVTAVVKGMLNFEMLRAFLQAARQPLRRAEQEALQQHLASRCGETCSLCGACPVCPRGVNVFEVVRNLNYYYAQAGRPELARHLYHLIPAEQRGGACDGCGECAAKCPQGLSIARHVQAAHLLLG
jgi:predicted aldo/keto reductase-like oxidoreductase